MRRAHQNVSWSLSKKRNDDQSRSKIPNPRRYTPIPVSNKSSGLKGLTVPGELRANSSTTPCDIAQIWAENMDAGGLRSAGIRSHRFWAAKSKTLRAFWLARARSGVRLVETPLSNMAI